MRGQQLLAPNEDDGAHFHVIKKAVFSLAEYTGDLKILLERDDDDLILDYLVARILTKKHLLHVFRPTSA